MVIIHLLILYNNPLPNQEKQPKLHSKGQNKPNRFKRTIRMLSKIKKRKTLVPDVKELSDRGPMNFLKPRVVITKKKQMPHQHKTTVPKRRKLRNRYQLNQILRITLRLMCKELRILNKRVIKRKENQPQIQLKLQYPIQSCKNFSYALQIENMI